MAIRIKLITDNTFSIEHDVLINNEKVQFKVDPSEPDPNGILVIVDPSVTKLPLAGLGLEGLSLADLGLPNKIIPGIPTVLLIETSKVIFTKGANPQLDHHIQSLSMLKIQDWFYSVLDTRLNLELCLSRLAVMIMTPICIQKFQYNQELIKSNTITQFYLPAKNIISTMGLIEISWTWINKPHTEVNSKMIRDLIHNIRELFYSDLAETKSYVIHQPIGTLGIIIHQHRTPNQIIFGQSSSAPILNKAAIYYDLVVSDELVVRGWRVGKICINWKKINSPNDYQIYSDISYFLACVETELLVEHDFDDLTDVDTSKTSKNINYELSMTINVVNQHTEIII